MSMPAYTKSTRNSLTNTGLCIELADVDYDNDEQKVSDFVNSKNWEFYVNTCNSYGFMIDTNTPWRLADYWQWTLAPEAKQFTVQ